MSFNDIETKKIQKAADNFLDIRRPPVQIRDKVDIGYKIEKNNIIVFEIRPQWDNPKNIIEIPIAKATYNKSKNIWKIFWQKSDLKWHVYDPDSQVNNIEDFFSIVDRDDYCCFWG